MEAEALSCWMELLETSLLPSLYQCLIWNMAKSILTSRRCAGDLHVAILKSWQANALLTVVDGNGCSM